MPDAAGAVFQHGLWQVLRHGWLPFFRSMAGLSQTYPKARRQFRAMGIAIETRLNARANDAYDLIDTYRPETRIERTLGGASNAFMVANLLAPWTDLGKTIAATVSGDEIFRAARAVTEGKATRRQITSLAASGIDDAMARRIWKQWQNGGGAVDDGVMLPNTGDWGDAGARLAFEAAVAREADIAIVTPGQEKALWLSNPVLNFLGQYKTFMASATERLLIANLQRSEAQTLSGLLAGVTAGMMGYALYSAFAGRPVSDDPADWVREGVSRSGVLGWFEEGNTLLSKATSGRADVYRLLGSDRPLSRYESRDFVGQLLGPTGGKIAEMARVSGAVSRGDWNAADTHRLRRLLAAQNLFYLRRALDEVERGVNDAAGLATPQ